MREAFADLVEEGGLRELFEAYSRTTGIGASLTDIDGRMLASAGWQDICTRFHRVHPCTASHCAASDAFLAEGVRKDGSYTIHQCGNGLVEVAAPVIIENVHVATSHVGQFLFQRPDREFFRRQAAEFGFEEQSYLDALDKVPVRSQEQAGHAVRFLARMAGLIGSLGLANRRIRESTAELRASERRFRTLIEQASDAAFLSTLDGRILDVNQRACESLGYTRGELLGMTLADIDVELESHHHRERYWSRLVPGGRVSFEGRHRRKDTSTFPVEISLGAMELDGERVMVGLVRDITERRETEEALRRTQYAVDRARDAVFWVASNGSFVYVNEAACRSLGYRREELLSLTVFDIDPSFPRETWADHWQKTRERDSYVIETSHRTREGRVFPVEIAINFMRFADREYHCAYVREITERKQVEASLRESEQRFRALVEQAADAIFLHDLDGRLVEVNPRACESLGYTRDELLGMTVGEVDPTFAAYDHVKEHWSSLSPNRTVSFEAQHRRKDGTVFPVDVRLCLIEMHGRRLVLAAVRDIADRKRAEEEKARLEDQLRQAQKMEAVGQLAGGVAHDFNNILTAVLGHVELLIATQEGNEALRSGLAEIQQAARRAAALTRRLLVFSRRDVARPQELDLNRTLAEMEKMLRRLIAAHITLEVRPVSDPLHVRVDPGQIEQVIMNLALNARDAMPHGGRLVLETARVSFDEPYVACRPEARGGPHAVLTVSDTGCGMDGRTLQRMFEPFFTTKPPGQGTGLGLSTVYGIIKQAGGHVMVYSEPGCGTTFRVFLPVVAAKSSPALADADEREVPTGHERILVCEDDASVRKLTVSMLRSVGYTVIEAATGSEALDAVSSGDHGIQLLVSDVILPDTNGKKLSEAIERIMPSIRTLFISGYTANIVVHHGVLDAEVELLEKPFSRGALLHRVRSLLDRGRPSRA